MSKFKVGDIVRANCAIDDNESTKGGLAVVKFLRRGGAEVGLAFFKNVSGHGLENCPGGPLAKEGHGWWAVEDEIDLLNLEENQ